MSGSLLIRIHILLSVVICLVSYFTIRTKVQINITYANPILSTKYNKYQYTALRKNDNNNTDL